MGDISSKANICTNMLFKTSERQNKQERKGERVEDDEMGTERWSQREVVKWWLEGGKLLEKRKESYRQGLDQIKRTVLR